MLDGSHFQLSSEARYDDEAQRGTYGSREEAGGRSKAPSP
jgi:hypothetical protein